MSANLQLWCFLFSFIYGIFFGLSSYFHLKIIDKFSLIFKLLISIVYIIDIVLGYILLMYYLNFGIFHFYFFIFILIGYLLSLYFTKKCKKIN